MKTLIELSLIIIAPAAVMLDIYIIKSGSESLSVLAVSVILNITAVILSSWLFFRAEFNGRTLQDYLLRLKVWKMADRLERERCAREYGKPRRLTEFERRKKLYDEIMTRKGY